MKAIILVECNVLLTELKLSVSNQKQVNVKTLLIMAVHRSLIHHNSICKFTRILFFKMCKFVRKNNSKL